VKYVVAINIERFKLLCQAMDLRGDGKSPHTGEQVMTYMHRAEAVHKFNPNIDSVYLSEGWTQRADCSNFIVCLKSFRILGGKIEGADLGLVVPYKRHNRHLGPGPGRHHGLRIISGGGDS
jgi:hypothetical protein